MRISPTTTGALRLLVSIADWLREHPEHDAAPLSEVANRAGLSGAALKAVRIALTQAGYLTTDDAPRGAIRLALPPERIPLGAVVTALETPPPPAAANGDPHLAHLERILDWASHEVERFLGQYTVDQMLTGPRDSDLEDDPDTAPSAPEPGRPHLRLVTS